MQQIFAAITRLGDGVRLPIISGCRSNRVLTNGNPQVNFLRLQRIFSWPGIGARLAVTPCLL